MDDTTGIAITDDPRAQLEKRLGSQNLFRIPQLLLECVKIPPGWRGISVIQGEYRSGTHCQEFKKKTPLGPELILFFSFYLKCEQFEGGLHKR